jgi:glycosyltransferase involved in cell wall biosynthesis
MTTTVEGTTGTAPLVTAVLVCWNHERFLREAVLSALRQTYSNIQMIVIDNGSTDQSRDRLAALKAEHEFTLVCQENVGLVRALNQALAMARGKYFAGLATDDVWLLDKTAKQVAFLEANPDVALVSGQIGCIDAEGSPLDLAVVVRPGDVSFSDLMSYGCFVYGPTTMCRVETLRAVGGYDESLRIEDYSIALKLAHQGRRIVALPDVLTLYRRHGNNWTAGSVDLDVAAIGAKYRHTPEYRAFYRRSFPMAFWQLVRDGRKREAMHVLLTEPVRWDWSNVGRGMLRMLIPYSMVRAYRALSNRASRGGDRVA